MKQLFKKSIVAILRLEAKIILKKYHPHIIAITGSVGKTSTKDAIFCVLKTAYHVRKSDKSYNSEIGLPLTILGVQNAWSNPIHWIQNIIDGLFLILLPSPYPEWLVLEVGADRPGDISTLAPWLKVDVAVITRLPEVPVHVEFFDSPEEVIQEKMSLIDAIKKGGTLVAYGDDAHIDRLISKAKDHGVDVVTYGMSGRVGVRGADLEPWYEQGESAPSRWPMGMTADIFFENESLKVSVTGVIGAHPLLSVLAAVAVGKTLGMSKDDIADGVGTYLPPSGRMRLLPGIKQTLIIDDTYNSSPAATDAALDSLALIHCPRKIAVLGDMMELGKFSVDEHRKIGALASKRSDVLVTVGFRARDIAQGALDNGMQDSAIFQYEDSEKAGEELQAMVQKDDCILVKGSQSIRAEKIVEQLMLEPERAEELLVRQDAQWRRR